MHLLNTADRLAFKGAGRISVVDFSKELKSDGPPPCLDLEHREGVCPLGLSHSVEDYEYTNTVLTSLKTSIIDQMTNTGTPLALRVLMIGAGTSSTATTAGMTTLGAEYYRAAPTEVVKVSGLAMSAYWFFGTTVANAGSDLQEWGIFGGPATSTANSGTMLARFLQTFAKNSTKTISGQYDFTIA